MNFIKKYYEKILFAGVLLGLVAFLLVLPFIISHQQNAIGEYTGSLIHRRPKPLAALDMTNELAALARAQSSYSLDFTDTNRLFNPVQWQEAPDRRLIKIMSGKEVGPDAVKVTAITNLLFILKLDSIEPSNQFSAARYVISVELQNAASPAQRHARQHFISVGEGNNTFSLLEAKGPPDNPQLTLRLADTGDTVTLSKSAPFTRVDGHMADLWYPPERKPWTNQRVGAELKINRADYIIVAIDSNDVVLSAESNQRKYVLTYQP